VHQMRTRKYVMLWTVSRRRKKPLMILSSHSNFSEHEMVVFGNHLNSANSRIRVVCTLYPQISSVRGQTTVLWILATGDMILEFPNKAHSKTLTKGYNVNIAWNMNGISRPDMDQLGFRAVDCEICFVNPSQAFKCEGRRTSAMPCCSATIKFWLIFLGQGVLCVVD
jgi:hypothetical protein